MILVALAACLVVAACGTGELDDLLQCNSEETVRTAQVIAGSPDAALAAAQAFKTVLTTSPGDIRANGGGFLTMVDDRVVAHTTPLSAEASWRVAEVRMCAAG